MRMNLDSPNRNVKNGMNEQENDVIDNFNV